MKIRPEGPSCLFRTEGQTDMTKLIAAFCNFKNVPKKVETLCIEIRISHKQSSVCQQLFCKYISLCNATNVCQRLKEIEIFYDKKRL